MKILIVMDSGFDTYGPSLHLYKSLIEDILSAGHSVHLIESHSSGLMPDIPDSLSKHLNFSYDVIPLKEAEKKQFARRYFYGIKYYIDCKKALKKCNGKYDIVMMQSCPWAPFAVSIVKKCTKTFTLWNIQDMFPGASIANGVMKQKWMQKIFFLLHKVAYKKADFITVISDDMKKKVLEQYNCPNKIEVIPDWFDDQTVHEVEWGQNRFVAKYNMSKEKFYVQYAGTMGFNFDYKLVIKVAKMLESYEDIVFQMVGFGSQKEDFEKAVENYNLKNVVFLPIQPQEMVSDVYSACDVCFIPLPKGVIGNSVPSKAGLLMACKRAIITSSDENSYYNKMINDNKVGYAFGTCDVEGIANGILDLYKNRAKCKQFGINGYNYGFELYSRTLNTSKYINLFESLIKGR